MERSDTGDIIRKVLKRYISDGTYYTIARLHYPEKASPSASPSISRQLVVYYGADAVIGNWVNQMRVKGKVSKTIKCILAASIQLIPSDEPEWLGYSHELVSAHQNAPELPESPLYAVNGTDNSQKHSEPLQGVLSAPSTYVERHVSKGDSVSQASGAKSILKRAGFGSRQ